MKLCKSYRSTFEITSFAQKIQPNNELEPIMRHGEHPKILPFKNTEEEIQGIADLVNSFRNSHYTSLGIICKTESQAKNLFKSSRYMQTTSHFCPIKVLLM